MKLPPISLPKFSGSIDQYRSFLGYFFFLAPVHANDEVDEVQKFHFLKSSLEGDAAKIISGFSITKENYSQAVDLLKQRYDNKRSIVNAHLGLLVKYPKIKNESP